MTTLHRTAAKRPEDRANFILRLVTGLVALPLVVIITYLGELPFTLVALIFAVLGALEFFALGTARQISGNYAVGLPATLGIALAIGYQQEWIALLIFVGAAVLIGLLAFIQHRSTARERTLLTLLGILYTVLPAGLMIVLRAQAEGILWITLIFGLTWGTDTLAYFGGRMLGRTPLAPQISPKKTREGAIIGIAGGFLVGLITLLLAGKLPTLAIYIPLLLIAPPLAVLGDLLESAIKRYFDVGDSHVAGLNILPGHGGILDRTDALSWVIVATYVYLLVIGMIR
jgi:phosphatidate cytidylyltransferase